MGGNAEGSVLARRRKPSKDSPYRHTVVIADPAALKGLRLERARTQDLRIEPLPAGPCGPRFRVFSASRRRYEVEIRDPSAPVNLCSCPDFAVNLLGTCKHIQSVLDRNPRLRRRRAGGLVYLARVGAPRVAFHALGRLSTRARTIREAFFRPDGTLAFSDPENLDRLLAAAHKIPDLAIGSEIVRYLQEAKARREWASIVPALDGKIRAARQAGGLLSVALYPYQIEGVRFLLERRRGVLADEMGLGKTAQCIAAAWLLAREGRVRRAFVVCPASVKHQWELEIRRFCGAPAAVVSGPPAARHRLYREGPLFTIANYEQVFRDREFLRDAALRWDLVVLDEAQRIKNWRAKTSDAIKDLRDRSEFAFVLTGTPLENNIEELFSVCQFVDPSVLGPLWKFYDRYYRLDERGHTMGYHNLDELRRRVAPIFLRRRKEEVQIQLPPRVSNTYYVPMTPQQLEAHGSWLSQAAILFQLMKRRPLTAKEHERLMMYLLLARRSCDDSSMGKGEPSPSPKLKELERLVEELVLDGGRKAIVFSEWIDMLDLVAGLLRRRKIGHVYLHGGVPSHQRGGLLDRFREDPRCRLFLSTEAGGTGLNLQTASAVINLDLPWNPARLEQRIGRAHRMGQTQTVQVVNLVAEGSIENRIESLLGSKRELFEAVFGKNAARDEIPLPSSMGPARQLLELLVEEKKPEVRPRSFEEAPGSAPGAPVTRVPANDDARAAVIVPSATPETEKAVRRVAEQFGEPPPKAVAAEAAAGFRGEAPPAAPAPVPPPAAKAPPLPGAAALSGPERALRAARCLQEAGFAPEAVAQAGRALLASLGALLERRGLPVPSPQLVPLAVRRDLIARGVIPRPTLDRALAAVAWCQSFDAGAGADDATATELLSEIQSILAELDRGG